MEQHPRIDLDVLSTVPRVGTRLTFHRLNFSGHYFAVGFNNLVTRSWKLIFRSVFRTQQREQQQQNFDRGNNNKKTTANEKFKNLTMATARPAGQSPIDEDQAAASGPDGLSFITEPLFVLFIWLYQW